MAMAAEISVEENVSFRLLEQRVEHIQSDVAEIKDDMRRLEAKIESNRDTTSDVKDSVAALRVEMKDGFAAANQRRTELATAITVLDAKFERLDEKTVTLDRKIGDTFGVLDRKIDQTRDDLKAWVEALFDRKLFRAMSVLVGAMASIGMLITAADKISLNLYTTIGIAIAIPVVLITATFLATRTSR